MQKRSYMIWLVTLLTLGSGLMNLYSVIGPSLPERVEILTKIFPLEFLHISRFFTILIGFALVISSINIFKRKKRAYDLILILSCLSIVFHITKGLDYEDAILSVILLIVLILTGKYFTVKSSIPDIRLGALRFTIALTVTIAYGTLGFWLLDRNDFGINFHLGESISETFRYLSFIGDPNLIPYTCYAHWFLNSMYLISIIAIAYAISTLYRPVNYVLRIYPQEREKAKAIVEKYGRHAMDYFKLWPDKSFFFSASQNTFLAYRVGNHFAVVLADPVGIEDEIEQMIRDFMTMCKENDWGIAFHQTLPDFIPIYEKLGFKKLKIGDDAIVDLTKFTLAGKEGKEFRHTINKMEAEGIRIEYYRPPIPEKVFEQVKQVSDEWLQIEGKRERSFTLGKFESDYVRSTPIMAAIDQSEEVQGFVNLIPSCKKGESTIDLMRRRSHAPHGIMDYIFVKLILHLREQGFQTFNFGMAPMSGFQNSEEPSLEERAIHYFFQHMNFLFSFKGLRAYKAKFATSWEPRYVIYQNVVDLPRHAMAINTISEL